VLSQTLLPKINRGELTKKNFFLQFNKFFIFLYFLRSQQSLHGFPTQGLQIPVAFGLQIFVFRGFDDFPIGMLMYFHMCLLGQQTGHGFVTQHGFPWHSDRGQSVCNPFRMTQSHLEIKIPDRNSNGLQRCK
jgi:hypothetical protein